jgi:hypothetical protein
MCSVSATHDYFARHVPIQQWTRPMFNEYQEIIRRLGELDKKLNQPDCEDAHKAEWTRRVEERLAALEREAVSPNIGTAA